MLMFIEIIAGVFTGLYLGYMLERRRTVRVNVYDPIDVANASLEGHDSVKALKGK